MVALGEIARTNSLILTAVVGGVGAMLGDLVIFRFVKNSLANDFAVLMRHGAPKRLTAVFRLKFFRWFIAFLGALVIASPLPDELGLAMMGLTKVKTAVFLPLSFVFNAIGILIIGLVARSL
jgi:membrane protein DedA with SNARE-associated domain